MSMQNQWHAMRELHPRPVGDQAAAQAGHRPADRRVCPAVPARPGHLPARRGTGRRGHGAVSGAASASSSTRASCPRTPRWCSRVAGIVAGLAVFDAFLGVVQRYFTSRVGEGLIYDLRTQVFEHVQRQPIAFFTRAQTGSLVSRLNSDVIGAQQALTSTLSSVVSSVLQLVLVLAVDVHLVLAGHGRRAGADPDLPVPGAPGRPQAAAADQGVDAAGRPDGLDHDGAVQRGRRDAGQAVRPACRRARTCSPAGPAGCATSAC